MNTCLFVSNASILDDVWDGHFWRKFDLYFHSPWKEVRTLYSGHFLCYYVVSIIVYMNTVFVTVDWLAWILHLKFEPLSFLILSLLQGFSNQHVPFIFRVWPCQAHQRTENFATIFLKLCGSPFLLRLYHTSTFFCVKNTTYDPQNCDFGLHISHVLLLYVNFYWIDDTHVFMYKVGEF